MFRCFPLLRSLIPARRARLAPCARGVTTLLPCRAAIPVLSACVACLALLPGSLLADADPPRSFSLLVSSDDAEARLAVERGMSHLLTSWDEAAYIAFTRAHELDPSCVLASWGILLSSLGSDHHTERAEALATLRDAVRRQELLPQERAYCEALALLLGEGSASAAACVRRCAERFRRDRMLQLWEIVFLRNGYDLAGNPRREQERALALCEDILSETPDAHAALFLRALLEETAPSISPRAIECARRAVASAPGHPVSRLLLGHLLARAGMWAEAVPFFQQAADLYESGCREIGCGSDDDDGQVRALLALATAQWKQGDRRASLQTRRKLKTLTINDKRLDSRRSRLLIWEVRSLPARIALSEEKHPDAGDIKACMQAAALPGMPNEDPAREYLNCLRHVMETRLAHSRGDQWKASTSLDRAQRALDALMAFPPRGSDAVYVARAVEASRVAVYRTRSLLTPSTAEFWKQDADEAARPPSSLLPPVMP